MKLEEKVRSLQVASERYVEVARRWLLTGGGFTNGVALEEAQRNLTRALAEMRKP
jgi:hypothetical protein